MGQSNSSNDVTQHQQKRRSFLITPKKLIRVRRQTSCENSGAPFDKCGYDNTQTQKKSNNNKGEKAADLEQTTKTKTFNHDNDYDGINSLHLPAYEEPVFSPDRHTETTHTKANVEVAKHSEADKILSHDLTVKDESLIEENLLPQLRELIENFLCGGNRIDGDIVIEIDSIEKTLKILPQSSLVKGELEETPSQGGSLIIIREHITPSSCDTIFTDAVSSIATGTYERPLNLSVQKLEQFDIATETQTLQIVKNESINLEGKYREEEELEMPIVKNSSSNGQQEGSDKGIFNVSRVKKVELSEIPLSTDICNATAAATATTTASTEQQTVTPSIQKSSNGSGSKVLHRVISLTTANHNDNNNFSKPTKNSFIPEKLQFSAYEKFEGQMLINWFVQSIPSSLKSTLNENDLYALTMQYCTNLLIAGIIKPLDTATLNNNEVFKANLMYQWTHKDQSTLISPPPNTPGKLEAGTLWPHSNDKKIINATNNVVPSPKRIPDGESKIPKLVSTFASTPKLRTQPTNLSTPDSSILLNGNEFDQTNRIIELKNKLSKCDMIQEILPLIRGFLSEHAMVSSESSTNSVALTSSLINASDTTIFDRSEEQTIFNIIDQQRKPEITPKTPARTRTRTTPKSRTSPSTPTGLSTRTEPKRLRKNLSVDSVSSTTAVGKEINSNGALCRRCMLISPKKVTKRFVDKATVMDVEPIVMQKIAELKDVEIQTDTFEDEKKEKEEQSEEKKEVTTSIPIPPPPMPPPPPPPPCSMPPPPPPPLMNCPKPPPAPPPPLPNGSIPAAPNLPPPPPLLNLSSKGPCPFPPPISLNTGPGKLQNTTSSNSSSYTTANGNNKPKPKPLPLPASEFYQTNTLRKNAVNPPKPMKPLYWTRIVTPIAPITQDSVDGPTTPEGEIDKDELWKEIDETKLDNIDEFTELFSRQGVVPKAKESTPLPKIKAIKVLDSKRSQNVGIFVRSIHVHFIEIEHAIYHCDTSVVSQETLQNIMSIRGTNEELSLIKEAIAAHEKIDDSPPLDAPEHFLLKISQISSSAERISCIVFQDEFEEQCTSVSRKLLIVKSLCEFLLENEGLKEVFSIILTLGNFMNGGNRQRGQADGFGLEILGKLKDVKSKDPKITLLHFIVKTYIERCRKSGCAISDLVLPIPDPNDVDKSLSIDFEECKHQLNSLMNKVEECKKTTEKVISTSTADHVQPFKDKMESFLQMAEKKIESRFQKVDECLILFVKTLKFYKYMAKGGTLEETTPAQFFEYWTSFTSDFNGIFKKELVILTNELLKKSRQVTKPQSKPAQGENNLKARINRLKSRDK